MEEAIFPDSKTGAQPESSWLMKLKGSIFKQANLVLVSRDELKQVGNARLCETVFGLKRHFCAPEDQNR